MINYTNDSIGLSINASFNVSGEKLVLTPGGTPDVYDQPRPSLDLSINYKLNEKVNLNMKARNFLTQNIDKSILIIIKNMIFRVLIEDDYSVLVYPIILF